LKQILITALLVLSTFIGYSQNYYEEYPLNISLATNGNLSRIQCSTFDSVLQTTVSFNTEWVPYTLIISGSDLGKVGYTFWNSIGNQVGKAGFIIYDSYAHEFISEVKNYNLAINQDLNVICGPVWIDVVLQRLYNGDYVNDYYYYRYNTIYKKWCTSEPIYLYGWSSTSDIWTFNSIGNTDRLVDADDNSFIYYDPVKDSVIFQEDYIWGSIDWQKEWEDCYIGSVDTGNGYFRFYMYDPQLHQLAIHPRINLIGDEAKGIFYGNDQDSTFKKFFFLYDLSLHQWVTDSVYSSNLTNIKIKDRVVAWMDITPGFSQKVFCMVYNPISHSWIKDSTATLGTISGYQIQNGTVKWNDANGSHARGYDSNLGWGNYNTTMLLNFHLTDFTSQGYNMIHVRNYSIGSDSIYFSFGDGVVSSNKRNVLWHTYNESGTYDVCIHDSTGTLSWCQQVTLNLCSASSLISAVNDTICEGDSTALSLSSYSGSIQWQSKVGASWVDETGTGATTANYLISPNQTTKYRAIITNGICLPAYSNDQIIKVYPTIGNYQISDSTYSKCSNLSNQISVNIPNVTYQWQKNNSGTWNNIANAIQMSYVENSNLPTQYRVLLSSGPCFVDTSDVVTVNVATAPPPPTVTSGRTCGPGIALLQATSSSQNIYWFSNYQDTILHIGSTFSPYTTATTTYKVKAVDGTLLPIGYANTSIGATDSTSTHQKGIRFYCNSPTTLEYFYIYPMQTGSISIRLKKAGTQIVVDSYYTTLQSVGGPYKVSMNANLFGGMSYDLVVESTNLPLQINTSGISYPITSPVVPVTILGYIDSTFHTTNDFYNFYDLHFTTGCKSNQMSITANYYTALNAANITPIGALSFCQGDSVYLTAPASGSYDYEWLRNGVTVSTLGNTYWAKTAGAYTLIINNTNCSDTSSAINVQVPCITTFDPVEKIEISTSTETQFNIFYSSGAEELYLDAELNEDESYTLVLIDQTGKEVFKEYSEFSKGRNSYSINVQKFSSGLYILKLQSEKNKFVKRWLKN